MRIHNAKTQKETHYTRGNCTFRRELQLSNLVIQWHLGIRQLWNKSNLVYVLFEREKILPGIQPLEYDSCAMTFMSQKKL
jgi:hypothetical protein